MPIHGYHIFYCIFFSLLGRYVPINAPDGIAIFLDDHASSFMHHASWVTNPAEFLNQNMTSQGLIALTPLLEYTSHWTEH